MQYCWLLALCFVPLTLAEVAKRRCPGGYQEGAEAVLGRYWYKCRDGELEPKGCIADDGSRVNLYGTVDSKTQAYRFECTLDRQGFLQFEYRACLFNGKAYGVNERWSDDKYVYVCVREGDHLRMDVNGCMDGGREVYINERVRKGDFLYQCKQSENGTCSMCPVGCVMSNKEYLIGDSFDDGNYWYTCSNGVAGRITLQPNGCISQGRRLKDNEHFTRGDTAYECQVDKDKIVEKIVGCAARDDKGNYIEKQFNTFWNEGSVEVKCTHDTKADRAVKVPIRCIHKNGAGVVMANIDAGCYRILEGSAIGCLKDRSSGQIRVKVYKIDEIGTATSEGLRFC